MCHVDDRGGNVLARGCKRGRKGKRERGGGGEGGERRRPEKSAEEWSISYECIPCKCAGEDRE